MQRLDAAFLANDTFNRDYELLVSAMPPAVGQGLKSA